MEDERIRALILAVGDYETLPDLTTVEPDAEALAEVLEQPTVGAYAVKRLDSPIASLESHALVREPSPGPAVTRMNTT